MINKKFEYKIDKEIAECVGLWLAEGDNKCSNEITFTNNEFSLIKFFHKKIKKLFSNYSFNIRLYIYTSSKKYRGVNLNVDKINNYIDKRARKPYYIWRLASVSLNKKWKSIVCECKNDPQYYQYILRGFFAGEGNVKLASHNSRTVRISQKRSEFLEILLDHFSVEYKYRENDRSYYITHKLNWDKLAKIQIADLHPIKKEKFWEAYDDFKEDHYKNHYLRDSIIKLLSNPYMTSELAYRFNRSEARIQDIQIDLKKKGKINYFRIGSLSYWIRDDQNTIIISKLKRKYLNLLGKTNKNTKEIANYFKVNYKSSYRRLLELEKLGLVKRVKDKTWERANVDKDVIII